MRTCHSSNMPYTPRNTTMIVTMMMACMAKKTLTTTSILEMPHSITQSSQNALDLYWMNIHYLNVVFEEESVTQRWVGDSDIWTFFSFFVILVDGTYQDDFKSCCLTFKLEIGKANLYFTENWLCKNIVCYK